MDSKKQTAHLENWALVSHDSPYTAPELRVLRLIGQVSGHPRFHDGDVITTSRIVVGDANGIETRNTVYTLGEPAAEYEKQFPGARERLFKTLSDV